MKEVLVYSDSMLRRKKRERLENIQSFLTHVKAVFFYATPHHGSQLPNIGRSLRKGPLFADMSILNEVTQRRNEQFRHLRDEYLWISAGVAENRTVKLGKFKDLIVTEASARSDIDENRFYTVAANHYDVCRPEARISGSYRLLSDLVNFVLKEHQEKGNSNIVLHPQTADPEIDNSEDEIKISDRHRALIRKLPPGCRFLFPLPDAENGKRETVMQPEGANLVLLDDERRQANLTLARDLVSEVFDEVGYIKCILERVDRFAALLRNGWYERSAELDAFPARIMFLSAKHDQWVGLLRKFELNDDKQLSPLAKMAAEILKEEEEHVGRMKRKKLLRWKKKKRAFPGQLTHIVDKMEEIVNAGHQLLGSRVAKEEKVLLKTSSNHSIPLPFWQDRKYVPIADSVAAVQTALEGADGSSRVVTVYGGPGWEKTSLVKYIALQYQTLNAKHAHAGIQESNVAFPDGVFYLSCGQGARTRIKRLQRELLQSMESGPQVTGMNDNLKPEQREGEYLIVSSHQTTLRFKLAKQKTLIILDDVWEREVLEELLLPGEAVVYLVASQLRDVWPDAVKIQLEAPSLEEARQILVMYTEGLSYLPLNIQDTADAIIHDVDFHPLTLANVGLAIGATGAEDPGEWRSMRASWRDELKQLDFQNRPLVYGRSYQFALGETMNRVMVSLLEGERSLLFSMCLLKNLPLPEVVVKFFRRCIKPEEAHFEYRKYRNLLKDKSLLEISSFRGGNAESSPRNFLAVHSLRALYIRNKNADQLKSMVLREMEPFGSTRKNQSGISVSPGTSKSEKRNEASDKVLSAFMFAMFMDKPFWDLAESKFHHMLSKVSDIGGLPKSVNIEVDVTRLVETARGDLKLLRLVELLNPDSEEGWKQEAHWCARKIILRFICRQELDDESVACLIQLEHTTIAICHSLGEILNEGYWASAFVDENKEFSGSHRATTSSLFALLHNDATPMNIFWIVMQIFGGGGFPLHGIGILEYESHNTILNSVATVMKKFTGDAGTSYRNFLEDIWAESFILAFFHRITRVLFVMGEMPGLWDRVFILLLDKAASRPNLPANEYCRLHEQGSHLMVNSKDVLNTLLTLCQERSIASKVTQVSGALDLLWTTARSSGGFVRWRAVSILGRLCSVADNKERICSDLKFLTNMVDSLMWSEERGERELGKDFRPFQIRILGLLGELAISKEIQKVILSLCPDLMERIQILERFVVQKYRSWVSIVDGYDVAAVSAARTIFTSTLPNPEINNSSSPISSEIFTYTLEGRFNGFCALQMYEEALLNYDMCNKLGRRIISPEQIVFAKVMSEDYAGATVDANDMVESLRNPQNSGSELSLGAALGQRGLVIRLSGRSLTEALADFDESLQLIRSSLSRVCFERAEIIRCTYHLLRHRGFLKHLMGNDTGARADAQAAQQLQLRKLFWEDGLSFFLPKLLSLPANYNSSGAK